MMRGVGWGVVDESSELCRKGMGVLSLLEMGRENSNPRGFGVEFGLGIGCLL